MNFKKCTGIALTLFCIFSISACNNTTTSEPSSSTPVESYVDKVNDGEIVTKTLKESTDRGLFIDNIEAYASTALYSATNLVNDSGMSGSEASFHKHTSSSPRDSMYLSKSDQAQNNVVLKLPSIRSIGYLNIWNYNNFAKINCGVKEFKVSTSVDGVHYQDFNNGHIYKLDIQDGNSDTLPSKIDNVDNLDLQGICAQYIKFDFVSNYGGKQYGLSEIRVYQYKEKASSGAFISANVFRTLKKNYPDNFENMVSGAGLNKVNSLDATTTNNPFYMSSTIQKEIVFTLNGNYPLSKIAIWNYNDKDNLTYGVKDIELYTSLDNVNYDLLSSVTIDKASGSNNEKASSVIDVNNVHTQYVKLKINSNYGGDRNGVSNISFIAGEGYASEINQKYTGLLSSYSGWSGADGVFNVRMNGDQSIGGTGDSVFNFSDTYIGTVDPVTKKRSNTIMKNNTFASYNGQDIQFEVGDNIPVKPEKDETRSSADAYYWLGDSFVSNNHYYTSGLYVAREGVLGFSQKGEDLVRFDIVDEKVDFSSYTIIKDSTNNKLTYIAPDGSLDVIFGSAIFENTTSAHALNPDGYIYNYGYRDDRVDKSTRSLVVCRVKEENIEDFTKYEYLSTDGWCDDITKTKPLAQEVSCEMSVVEVNDVNNEYYGKFILTYQQYTTGTAIRMAVSSSLTGEFSESTTMYSIPDAMTTKNLFFYNAKSHPTLSTKDELVFSYNVNESVFGANSNNADIYRPRFLSLIQLS